MKNRANQIYEFPADLTLTKELFKIKIVLLFYCRMIEMSLKFWTLYLRQDLPNHRKESDLQLILYNLSMMFMTFVNQITWR